MDLTKVLSQINNNYIAGNYDEAIKIIHDALSQGENSKLYVELGNCFYKQKELSKAKSAWEKAVSMNSKESYAYANLGNLYYSQQQVEKAISMWTVALISRPEDAGTCLNLAVAFNNKNQRFEAIKYFEKYLKYEENKNSDEYLKIQSTIQNCFNVANQCLVIGAKLHSEGNTKSAAEYYFQALANYPNLSKVNLNLGSIFFSDNNCELAIKYWLAAMHADPLYSKTYSNLAVAYDVKRDFDYAYCYYNKYMNFLINNKAEYYKVHQRTLKIKPIINKNSNLVEEHLKRAEEHLANCEFYEAIDEYKNYIILNPLEKENYKDLIKKLEIYINPEAEIITNCYKEGKELMSSKHFDEAQAYFLRIMRLTSQQSLEFTKAKAKYSMCEKAKAGII